MENELKDKDLEQVSGGGMGPDPYPELKPSRLKPTSQPSPQPEEEISCCDFHNMGVSMNYQYKKELYHYCKWCINWEVTSCSKGHF